MIDSSVGLGRVIGVGSSSCLNIGSYCLYNSTSLVEQVEVENSEKCQERCQDTKECTTFSFHRRWGRGSCALLTSCQSTFSCGEEEFCSMGTSAGCQCPKLEYQTEQEVSFVYSNWTCPDLDPYSSAIPPGTSCSVACPSWSGRFLSSTCLPSGSWSQTVPKKVSTYATTYSAPFPTPVDQPVFQCSCPDLGPFTYDPNTEQHTKFECDNWAESEYSKPGGWSISHHDRCKLYCSDETKPVTTVYCEAGKWKGEPERGFWCYNRPEKPGPSVAVINEIPSISTIPSTATNTSSSNSVKALFIGPDHSEALTHVEVLVLPELSKSKCSIPALPVSLKHYVMMKDSSGVVVCGGIMNKFRSPDCFKWTFGSKEWQGFPSIPPMKVKREHAKAVQLGNLWWITGGHDGKKVLSSTEIRHPNGTLTSHVDLPAVNFHHCMTRVNDTHVILVGGYDQRTVYSSAYMYNVKTGWKQLKSMNTGRVYHSCTMLDDDRLFVTGNSVKTTEFYSISKNEWQPGPPLPKNHYAGKMITVDKKTYLIGGYGGYETEIYRLDPIGSFWWKWTKVGQLSKKKRYFDAVQISISKCN